MLSVNIDGLMTAQQVADYLGIKRRSVYTYALRLGGFPQPTHVGRTPLWAEGEIKAWREAHPARHRSSN